MYVPVELPHAELFPCVAGAGEKGTSRDRREASNWAANMRRHNVELKALPGSNAAKDDDKLAANDWAEIRLLAASLKADVERRAAVEADAEKADRMRRRVSYESAYKAGV